MLQHKLGNYAFFGKTPHWTKKSFDISIEALPLVVPRAGIEPARPVRVTGF